MKLVNVFCENTNMEKQFPMGTPIGNAIEAFGVKNTTNIMAAMVNNRLKDLNYEIYKPIRIQYIDYVHPDGIRTYQRTLKFLLFKVVHDLYPQLTLRVEHAVSRGYYCKFMDGTVFDTQKIKEVTVRMRQLVELQLPIEKKYLTQDEAVNLYKQYGHKEKALLIESQPEIYHSIYFLEDYPHNFFGPLLPNTSGLTVFELYPYSDGVLLRIPSVQNFSMVEQVVYQDKLFEVFEEQAQWSKILHVENIGSINTMIQNHEAGFLIKVSEALHEKKLSYIADKISKESERVKIILISGPSSSGKTTTSKRLSVHLTVNGLKPKVIELDNYFLAREHTPKDDEGEYDFESLYALNLELLNQHLEELLKGNTINVPKFDFAKGVSTLVDGRTMQLQDHEILLLEGIHALNPLLTSTIPNTAKFRIYASALTSVNLDGGTCISTTDNRLIRRIVRDNKFRGYPALQNLRRWRSVRSGEEKNIFPFQEHADIMFNSSLLYEINVLRTYAEPLLREIPPIVPEHADAVRLLKFLHYFTPITPNEQTKVPPTSVLREFIGGSSFIY